jgi:hypothetical protein
MTCPAGAERPCPEFFRQVQPRFHAADRLAHDIARGIDRNAALIIAPASAQVAWYLCRYAPFAVNRLAARPLARTRTTLPAGPAGPAGARGGLSARRRKGRCWT